MRRWFGSVALGLLTVGFVLLLVGFGLTMNGESLDVLADRMQILDLPAFLLLGLAVPVWKKIIDDWPTTHGEFRLAVGSPRDWSPRSPLSPGSPPSSARPARAPAALTMSSPSTAPSSVFWTASGTTRT